jgi:outer membrane immunogenic protein
MRGTAPFTIILALTAVFPAFAADLPPIKAAFPAAPVPLSWTGCHVGGHLGGVVSDDSTTNMLASSIRFNSPGFTGGGQIGCDYQFALGWVAGVEGRAGWTNLKNTHSATVRNLVTGVTLPSQFALRNDFLASTTARLGYNFAPHWLVFARGGAAWTNEKADDAFTTVAGVAVDPAAAVSRSGWTIGTGVNWAFASHWSASVEYNYYDFGSRGAKLTDANNVTVSISSVKDTVHAVTIGMDYHL